MALKKLLWRKYLFIDRTEGETEQAYWNEKRKKHLAGEHSAGIVHGLEVTETGPPSLRVVVAPGRALGADGSDPEVESAQELDLTGLVPGTGSVTAYVTLAFADVEVEPYFVEETGQFQNKYLQDAFLLEAGTTPPADPAVELARVELAAGATEITDAADPASPGPNEIDLTHREYTGIEVLKLEDLQDVSPDEAAAFNAMDSPSGTNPVATLADVAAGVAPVGAEVAAARGSKTTLDARLDVALGDDGSLKGHAATHKGDGADPVAGATPSVAGLMPAADKVKLDGIEAGAVAAGEAGDVHAAVTTGNPHDLDAADVGAAPASHVGAGGAEHAAATQSAAGFMSAADKLKLDTSAGGSWRVLYPGLGSLDAQLAGMQDGDRFWLTPGVYALDSEADVNRKVVMAGPRSAVVEVSGAGHLLVSSDDVTVRGFSMHLTAAGTSHMAVLTCTGDSPTVEGMKFTAQTGQRRRFVVRFAWDCWRYSFRGNDVAGGGDYALVTADKSSDLQPFEVGSFTSLAQSVGGTGSGAASMVAQRVVVPPEADGLHGGYAHFLARKMPAGGSLCLRIGWSSESGGYPSGGPPTWRSIYCYDIGEEWSWVKVPLPRPGVSGFSAGQVLWLVMEQNSATSFYLQFRGTTSPAAYPDGKWAYYDGAWHDGTDIVCAAFWVDWGRPRDVSADVQENRGFVEGNTVDLAAQDTAYDTQTRGIQVRTDAAELTGLDLGGNGQCVVRDNHVIVRPQTTAFAFRHGRCGIHAYYFRDVVIAGNVVELPDALENPPATFTLGIVVGGMGAGSTDETIGDVLKIVANSIIGVCKAIDVQGTVINYVWVCGNHVISKLPVGASLEMAVVEVRNWGCLSCKVCDNHVKGDIEHWESSLLYVYGASQTHRPASTVVTGNSLLGTENPSPGDGAPNGLRITSWGGSGYIETSVVCAHNTVHDCVKGIYASGWNAQIIGNRISGSYAAAIVQATASDSYMVIKGNAVTPRSDGTSQDGIVVKGSHCVVEGNVLSQDWVGSGIDVQGDRNIVAANRAAGTYGASPGDAALHVAPGATANLLDSNMVASLSDEGTGTVQGTNVTGA